MKKSVIRELWQLIYRYWVLISGYRYPPPQYSGSPYRFHLVQNSANPVCWLVMAASIRVLDAIQRLWKESALSEFSASVYIFEFAQIKRAAEDRASTEVSTCIPKPFVHATQVCVRRGFRVSSWPSLIHDRKLYLLRDSLSSLTPAVSILISTPVWLSSGNAWSWPNFFVIRFKVRLFGISVSVLIIRVVRVNALSLDERAFYRVIECENWIPYAIVMNVKVFVVDVLNLGLKISL